MRCHTCGEGPLKVAVRVDEPRDEDYGSEVDLGRAGWRFNRTRRADGFDDAIGDEHRPLGEGG
jgi:hypothetical protein